MYNFVLSKVYFVKTPKHAFCVVRKVPLSHPLVLLSHPGVKRYQIYFIFQRIFSISLLIFMK